jgi:TRAP-type C4-dicarboxylate transport system permease small subunit
MQACRTRQCLVFAILLCLISARVMAIDMSDETPVSAVSGCQQEQTLAQAPGTRPDVQDPMPCAGVEQATLKHANVVGEQGKLGEQRIPAAFLFMGLWLVGFYLAKPTPASRKRGALH